MTKNFLKILAALTGISIIGYLFTRKKDFWEFEAAKDGPQPIIPGSAVEEEDMEYVNTPVDKENAEPKDPQNLPEAEAQLEEELAPVLDEKTEEEAPTPEPVVEETSVEPVAEEEMKAATDEVEELSALETETEEVEPSVASEEPVEANDEKEGIDFTVIGTATEAEKNDLKKIKGIGKALESKLNDVGVFTYSQISQLTPTVSRQLTDAISFTGRIEPMEWKEQAEALMK